jgi:AraC-like DNA-binding protein
MAWREIYQVKILPCSIGIGWPRARCAVRGDLGCLARHAGASGFRSTVLAVRLGSPERSLRREFKSALGIPLKSWLIGVRQVEVRHRLRGDESIAEIAASVGFSHPKELSREFMKTYGVTPTVFVSASESGERVQGKRSEDGSASV